MSLVWQDHTGTLTGSEKAVLLRMADFAADNGTQIFPSIKRVALDTGYSERNVQYAINNLVKKKYLTKTIRTSKSVHISNLYRINTAVLTDAASVDKPVDKPGIKHEGGARVAPGVVQNTSGGGARVACNPPLIHHIDPPPAKEIINCSNIEQLEREPDLTAISTKIPLAEKKKITADLKQLLTKTRIKP